MAGHCDVTVTHDTPSWGEYLSARPEATIYHDPRWGAIMARAYGNTPYYLTASTDGRIVGAVQLVLQKSLLFGRHLCSLPYFDAAGILADTPEVCDALIGQAESLRGTCGAEWVELRQRAPVGRSVPTRTDKVTLVLDLPADADALWKGLKAKVRNQVRKARSAELTALKGGAELLDDFHAVYSRTMRDLGSPSHGKRFFSEIVDGFGDAVSIFAIRSGGGPVAASITLTDGHASRVPWAGSDWRRRELNANMLLYWQMLEDACQRNVGAFDFGRSTRDAGTYRFKRQWGARDVPLHWHYLLSSGQDAPGLRPDSPKYKLMGACWKKLPLWLARALGPGIIGKLS